MLYFDEKNRSSQIWKKSPTLVSVQETSVDRSGPCPGLAMTVITLLPPSLDIFILWRSVSYSRTFSTSKTSPHLQQGQLQRRKRKTRQPLRESIRAQRKPPRKASCLPALDCCQKANTAKLRHRTRMEWKKEEAWQFSQQKASCVQILLRRFNQSVASSPALSALPGQRMSRSQMFLKRATWRVICLCSVKENATCFFTLSSIFFKVFSNVIDIL